MLKKQSGIQSNVINIAKMFGGAMPLLRPYQAPPLLTTLYIILGV